MGFQIIIYAGTGNFGVLTSPDQPPALLPLATHPTVWYTLEWVAAAGFTEALLIAGERDSSAISRWLSDDYKGAVKVTVLTCSEDKGTAGALRAVAAASLIKGTHLVLLNSEVISDVTLASLLARHRKTQSVATVFLAPKRAYLSQEAKPGKPMQGVDYIGLDATNSQLCLISGEGVKDLLKVSRSILRQAGNITLATSLLDTQCCILHKSVLDILEVKREFTSVKRDLIPYLVNQQFTTAPYALPKPAEEEDDAAEGGAARSVEPAADFPGRAEDGVVKPLNHEFLGVGQGAPGPAPGVTRLVAAYLPEPSAFCTRVSDVKSYLEVNRELASAADAAHLNGLTANVQHENYVHKRAEIGAKSTVGPACIVGPESKLAEKCSVKKSVLGRRCRLGASCKIVNSVIHDDVVIEEGCSISGSIVGKGAVLQAGASLRECQVAPGVVIQAGIEHRGEELKAGKF